MDWLGLLFAIASAPSAEAADFCADRPGLATGTCLIPSGALQLETSLVSWSSAYSGGDNSTELSIGSSILRIGVGGGGEVQLGWTPYVRLVEKSTDERLRHSGAGDASVAYKQVLAGDGGAVAAAVIPVINLPVARQPIGSGKVEGALLLPLDFQMGSAWSFTVTPEMALNSDEDGRGRHLVIGLSGGPELSLGERLAASVNLRILRDREPGGAFTESIGGLALAWLARSDLQFDVEVDAGLSRAAPDLQLLLGFSVRP